MNVPPPDLFETQPAPEPVYPFWRWEDVAVFFGMGLPSLIVSLLFTQGISQLMPQPLNQAMKLVIAQLAGYLLWFGSLVLLFRTVYERPFWRSLKWVMPEKGLGFSIFLGPILAVAIGWIGMLLQTPDIDMPFKKLLGDSGSMLLIGIFAVTVGPVCEELAFRGFLMPLLMRTFGAWVGITMAAVPFALLHGPQYAWSWRHIVLLILAGATFGGVRHVTGSTAAATLTHATYNLTLFAALLATTNRGF